jgi:hypothetical protein
MYVCEIIAKLKDEVRSFILATTRAHNKVVGCFAGHL